MGPWDGERTGRGGEWEDVEESLIDESEEWDDAVSCASGTQVHEGIRAVGVRRSDGSELEVVVSWLPYTGGV